MMVFTRPTAGRSRLTQGLFLSLIASILVLGVTATPAFAFAGDLDPTFDTDGKVTTAVPGLTAVRGTAVLPDGRIVVVGTSGPNTTSDFEVAIFLPNGAPDPSFGGGDGKAAFDAGGDDDAEAVAVNEEDNGSGVLVPRIYVAGKSGAEAVVMRIIPETSEKDPSFGTGGVATTVGLIGGVARDVLVQPDDSVLIAGGTTSGATGRDFLLARFTPSGTLDNTWNLTGMVITNNPVNTFDDEAWGVTLQFTDATNTSFKVVAGGQTDNRALGATSPNLNVAVARYSSSGAPDFGFGVNGWTESFDTAESEDVAFDVKVQPAPDGTPPGAIVAAGYTRATPASLAKFFVVRFNDVGGHDTTFNGTGKQTIDVPAIQGSADGARQSFARAMAVQPNRKLVLAGSSNQDSTLGSLDFAVVRLTPNGALDETFSLNGVVTTSMSGASDDAYDAVLQPDGKIVVAGESGSPVQIGVARYIGDPVAYLSGPAPATEGDSGTKNFIFTITTTAASSKVFDLVFKTSDVQTSNAAKGCAADDTRPICDYTTVSTTVRFLAGVTSMTVPVRVRGDSVAEPDEIFDGALSTITASDPATVFPARSTAPATIVNDDAASVGINDVAESEGVSGTVKNFTFTVTQSVANAPGVTTTVNFQTADGTATTADDDYEGRSGSVEIPAGASSAPVTVTVNGDDKVEPSEDFFVNLTSVSCRPSGCLTPTLTGPHSDPQGKGTILDDDDKAAKVEISDYSEFEGDDPAETTFNFVVTKTGTTTQTVTVRFKTDDCKTGPCEGTNATVAQEGTDYRGRNGQFTFEPSEGVDTEIVTVTVLGDSTPERNEIFKVTITAEGAQVKEDGGEGVGTIRNDDNGGGGECSPNASFFAYDSGFTGGVYVASGYVNNDNCADIITSPGPGGGPHVRVFSGADGSEIMGFMAYSESFTGGVRVAAGDVNNDGFDDIITSPGPGGGPHVRVFSGNGGGEITGFMAYDPSFTGGVYVASGYINDDGSADIITGADSGGGPHVRVFSGSGGGEILGFMAYSTSFTGGVRVASTDVNGDGVDDVITGPGAGGGPHVRVFSGNGGDEIMGFMAYDQGFTGGVFVASGYLNGDAQGDIVTGPGAGGGPHVRAFSGSGGGELKSFFAYDPSFSGGVRVASNDIDGDGIDDIVTGPGPGGGPHIVVFKT